jgi:heme-degrading monooxygenase HmoA
VIVRVFRVRARPGHGAAFEARAKALGFERMTATSGLRGWIAGKPLEPGDRDFVMVTLWQDLDALRAYAGEDWFRVDLPDEDRAMLESAVVDHYRLHDGALIGADLASIEGR